MAILLTGLVPQPELLVTATLRAANRVTEWQGWKGPLWVI